jgi:predicted enzyme related to lactoylglutathione lyase
MDPLLRKIDAVVVAVPHLDEGLAFYRDALGHSLLWRTEVAAGLGLPETDTELVLQTERSSQETDILVSSADEAAAQITAAGGAIVAEPFDIPVGRCAIVADPWGNQLVLLDLSKGRYVTDEARHVIGRLRP